MEQEAQGIWVADVQDRGALVRLIRAALAHGIALVELAAGRVISGTHVLQLRLEGVPRVVLGAELAGETATRAYALRLRPLDPSHVPELTTIAQGDGSALGTADGAMSASVRALFGPTASPEDDPDLPEDDDLQASTLFDPEAARISRAPPRPKGTEDDTLTIPARASMIPTAAAHGAVMVGRIIAHRYRIDSLLGSGSIGAVYKATHVDLPRAFAIKVLHPHHRADAQLLASLRSEARAASLLDHPNVTSVQDFGEEPDGLVYIVMEYLAGASLQAVLDQAKRLAPERAIAIMLQVCNALAAAHDRGIVHRDVKPDNIMLVPGRDDEDNAVETVKVCDFGIAALDTAPDPHAREWTAGTPAYMAPEQAHGLAEPRSDVYACGIVLYEMLTGRPPFVGESTEATLAKHANELPRPPSEEVPGGIDPMLDALVLRALEKAPARRFATMRELRAELKRLR